MASVFHSFCLLALAMSLLFAGFRVDAQPAQETLTILTNARQLRLLEPADTGRKLPVKLRAVVTVVDPGRTIFVQDETGGTYVNGAKPDPALIAPGDVIEVEGTTHSGLFVPGIFSTGVTVVGHARLPPPANVTFDDLLSTRWHYQRVEVSGVVRAIAASLGRERPVLTLAVGPRRLEIQLVGASVTNLPPLIDARVRIAGLAAGYINDKRQLVAPHLLVSRLEDIVVSEPAVADPFSLPVSTVSHLLSFNPGGVSGHRLRVTGVVTHQQPGEAIFLRGDQGGLLVQTAQPDAVRPGDVVEVAGFPAMGRFSALLEDAVFRVTSHEPPPEPIPTTVTQTLQGTNDANLVTLEAQLLEVLETQAESLLVLRSGNVALKAHLPRTDLGLRNGSTVRLTGVCRVDEPAFPGVGFRANPRTIDLLLRSPADIAVLSAPSWWTAQRLAVASATLLVLAVTALIWASTLRRRVAEQTEVIRQKVQREAALEERHRMAREMHDTLAQSFSGLGFQLNALNRQLPADADAAKAQLETARQMVRHGQEEFRRSLLNLRAQELERGSLAEALPDIARQLVTGTGIELKCEVQRPFPTLPENIENNLLRIGQECLNNAVRHAQAKRIELALTSEAGSIRLRIADDGNGFDPQAVSGEGHFGWRGMRERAEQIQAKLEVDSKPGHGTTVTVRVPIYEGQY